MEIRSEEYKDYLNEEYLNFKEASALLDISEKEFESLVSEHKIPTHMVAGAFARVRKKDVEKLKNQWRIKRELFPKPSRYFSHTEAIEKPTLFEKIQDFWYFNDFYIICTILIVLMVYFIVSYQ